MKIWFHKRNLSIKYVICALLLLFTLVQSTNIASASGGEIIKFADELKQRSEYYRAITEYYRFNSYKPNDYRIVTNLYKIGECFELSGGYDEALKLYSEILDKYPKEKVNSLKRISLVYHKTGKYSESNIFIDQMKQYDNSTSTEIDITRGLNYVGLEEYDKAKDVFSSINDNNGVAKQKALSYLSVLNNELPLRKKSTTTGFILSAILPGSGYVYIDKPGTAIAALIVIGGLGYITYEAFDNKLYGIGALSGVVAGGFYVGNIYGTIQGVRRYNDGKRVMFMKKFNF